MISRSEPNISKGMQRVHVNGAHGRMGSLAVKTIENSKDLVLAGTSDVGDDLRRSIIDNKADIVVDFTVASAGYEAALTIIESGARPVIGTSGFTSDQVANLKEICDKKRLGGLVVPNFSISAVLMMKFSKEAVRYLKDVEIIELHHDAKEDAPSGTALRTAELIEEEFDVQSGPQEFREIVPHVRGGLHCGIPIHSVRLPGLIAHQEVIFGGIGQSLTIRSDSYNREAFMPGVLLACRRVSSLDTLYYGLEHVL